MAERLAQVVKRSGRIERVPKGTTPVIELRLVDDQYVTGVALEQLDPFGAAAMERKTADWEWTVYVVTPL